MMLTNPLFSFPNCWPCSSRVSTMMGKYVAMMVLCALALASFPAHTSAVSPTLETRNNTIILNVQQGMHVFVQYMDEEEKPVGEPVAVVTETSLESRLDAFRVEVQQMFADAVSSGDYTSSPLVTQDSLDNILGDYKNFEVIPAIEARTRSDEEVAQIVDSQVSATDSALYQALMAKQDAVALEACSCVDPETIPSLIQTLAAMETQLNASDSLNEKILECSRQGLIYHPEPIDECHDAVLVDCGETIAAEMLPHTMVQVQACANDTTLGGDICEVACRAGYEPQVGYFKCGLEGWFGDDLDCVALDCVDVTDFLKPGMHDPQGACDDVVFGETCQVQCKDGFVAQGSLLAACEADQEFGTIPGSCDPVCGDGMVVEGESCDDGNTNSGDGCSSLCQIEDGYQCSEPGSPCTLLNHCNGQPDGEAIISPLGASGPSIRVLCKDSYYIIDPSRSDWSPFFNQWVGYSSPQGTHYGPAKNSLIANYYNSWREWDKMDLEPQHYALSFDCSSCDPDSIGKAYYQTGNYHGCYYYNRRCDMGSDGVCLACTSNYGTTSAGACVFRPTGVDSAYRASASQSHYAYNNCQSHWWHSAPSLGGSGRGCVCVNPTLEASP
eukprot:m.148221 g.148221  ORF g.148221 m.148221 type:complete len:612 (-) comp14171_c0_seq1:250-2085(-)